MKYKSDSYKEAYKQIHYVKMLKVKEETLKAWREKWLITFTGTLVRLTANFLTETTEATEQWDNTFKVVEEKTVNLFWEIKKYIQMNENEDS